MPNTDSPIRCQWVAGNELYIRYHDEEWGVPLHDDRRLFELLVLEGFQAGLSWLTILQKRVNFWRAFEHFDPEKVARYSGAKVEMLLQDAGIVRNRQKIQAAIANAQAFLKVREEYGTFDAYVWGFVAGSPVINAWKTIRDIPSRSEITESLSADLTRLGFKFVGPTICYAFMQSAGLVNDHTTDCFRYRELGGKPVSRRK